MKKLSANQIRSMWLDFFQEKNHLLLPTASLIPVEDPSLLWINSGVATLKPYFDGRLVAPAPRLVNSQTALRTNDIENVGITARHQTMFEMLGNFSIGNYFKEEAIIFAWELLTSPKWFAIDPKKLYVTVFVDDSEAYEIWTKKIGLHPDHVFKMGRKTNFWDVGQGPSGPNTEIFFDRGPKWDRAKVGPRLISDDLENDRYVEIWNIVFSQFNNDGKGNYRELPRKNIDTGAGLERLASIFQDTPTNFETDLFLPTIKKIESLTAPHIHYSLADYFHPDPKQTKINTAFKVIVDHLRAAIFAITAGVLPNNKDRGYVVRRLLRRAQVYGLELGLEQAFLHQLVTTSIQPMREFYPELVNQQKFVETTILKEEEKFLDTLRHGHKLLTKIITEEKYLSAKNLWLLFESFGFPPELSLEIAQKQNIESDLEGFKTLKLQAQTHSRKSRQASKAWNKQSDFYTNLTIPSKFTGWQETVHHDAKVVFIFQDEHQINELKNATGALILDQTPFYAEKGGQAADTGTLEGPNGSAQVIDVQEGPKHQPIHQVVVHGNIKVGDLVKAVVDPEKRRLTQKNHSATHLLHSALRSVLGEGVKQSGSYNDEQGLRLDFSFHRPLTVAEINQVQNLVHHHIKADHLAEVLFVSLKEAIDRYHALAFFGDKYDQSQVRIVKFGDFSCELCGGTHVSKTSEIEDFLITDISSKGKGIFRIKAITSNQAIQNFTLQKLQTAQAFAQELQVKSKAFKGQIQILPLQEILSQISQFKINSQNWTKLTKLTEMAQKLYGEYSETLNHYQRDEKIKKFNHLKPQRQDDGTNKIEFFTNDLSLSDLKQLADQLRARYENLIVILGSRTAKTGFLVVAISPQLQDRYSALEIFRHLPGYQTQGGGNATFAQGKYQSIKPPFSTKN